MPHPKLSPVSNALPALGDTRLVEEAIVVAREGNHWMLLIERPASCGGCEVKAGCITRAVSHRQSHTLLPIPVVPGDSYQPGDRVTVAVSGPALRSASLIAYLVPLSGLLAGIAAASRLPDATQLALGLLGLLCGLGVAKGLLRYLPPQGLVPEIVGFAPESRAAPDSL